MQIKGLKSKGLLYLDGAMGSMLQKVGLKGGDFAECLNITNPEVIEEIHRQYINAGSDIITTNTFNANGIKFKNNKYSLEEVITSAVILAKRQAGDKLVALDIGPTGQLIEPLGDISFEEAYDTFSRVIKIGVEAGADLILIETMSDLYEARAAVLAAKENSNLPVFCTMTFEANGRTLTGTDPVTMVHVLAGLGIDAVGVNCSLGPNEMKDIVKQIISTSKIPVIIQPNAGIPTLYHGETNYAIKPVEFAMAMKEFVEMGVQVIGGCCGTEPDFIRRTKELLLDFKQTKPDLPIITVVSSSRMSVVLGQDVKIIGDRINPNGMKNLKDALENDDMDYIVDEALEQKHAGANILAVDIEFPEINQKKVIVDVIKELQSRVDLPLQIDSISPEVIENALRVYNGKAIISINGTLKSMEAIFPLAKKYGACVVASTLDEKGIPKSAEARYLMAEKIINKALEYNISKEDIIINCGELPRTTEPLEASEVLKTVKMIKERLGVVTTLGATNILFELPNSELINTTFFTKALEAGLDAPIINPLDQGSMGIICAYKARINKA